jgi:hypothetical protein
MSVALSVMLAGQTPIPRLKEERQMVNTLYGRTQNLLRWLYLMGLIQCWKMFQEGIDYVANAGIEYWVQSTDAQMIERLKSLHH